MTSLKRLIAAALFTALIAVGAFIKIPIPAMPVTLQVMFVILAGLLLGPRYGLLAAFCYMALGLIGVPIFTGGGGIGYVLKPTFGYIIGFLPGAWIAGYIARRVKSPSFIRLLAAGLAGVGAIYAIGIAYYWAIYTFYIGSGTTFRTLFLYCFLLVIPGDAASCVISALIGKRMVPYLEKKGY